MTINKKVEIMVNSLLTDGTLEVYADDKYNSEFNCTLNTTGDRKGLYSYSCTGARRCNNNHGTLNRVKETLEYFAKYLDNDCFQ